MSEKQKQKREKLWVSTQDGNKILIEILKFQEPRSPLSSCIHWDRITYRGADSVFAYYKARLSWDIDTENNRSYLCLDKNVIGIINGITPPEITTSLGSQIHLLPIPANYRFIKQENTAEVPSD